jgi:hypothetical protein
MRFGEERMFWGVAGVVLPPLPWSSDNPRNWLGVYECEWGVAETIPRFCLKTIFSLLKVR